MKNEKWNITIGELEFALEKIGEHSEIWVEIDGKMYPIRDYSKLEDGKLLLRTK